METLHHLIAISETYNINLCRTEKNQRHEVGGLQLGSAQWNRKAGGANKRELLGKSRLMNKVIKTIAKYDMGR